MKLKAMYRWELIAITAMLMTMFSAYAWAQPLNQKAPSVQGHDDYKGDVTGVRIVRRVEQHPDSWRIWGMKTKHLIVAFGAMTHGKKDMGDIFASVSKNDGKSWGEPVVVFDHNKRQGVIQFAYANPVLYRAPGQDVIWCYAMRCPIVYRNSEESQLVGAFTADGGHTWTQVEMAMHYTGPLITNAGIVETV
ncbi:MAG: sialidase family protein, partial [Planctomycetota bacterium]